MVQPKDASRALDLTKEQFAGLYRWATRAPEVSEAYVFHCRMDGSRTAKKAQLDLAVVIRPAARLGNQETFDARRPKWEIDLARNVQMPVVLHRLHASETAEVLDAVNDAGFLIYRRSAERARRNDIGRAKRLELDRIKSPFSLVPLREAADLFVAEDAANERQKGSAAAIAYLQFYKRLSESVCQRYFEGRARLFVVDGVLIRWNRRAAAFLGDPPKRDPLGGEESAGEIAAYWQEAIAGYWSKTWASQKVALAWCQTNNFSVPPRWIVQKSAKSRAGRKPRIDPMDFRQVVFELMDYHGDFDATDREWNAQARLEEAVRAKLNPRLGTSRLRDSIKPHLRAWRKAKAGHGR